MERMPRSFDGLLESLYASVLDSARFEEFAVGLRQAMNAHVVAIQTDEGEHQHDVKQHYFPEESPRPASDINDDARINQFFLRGSDLVAEGVVVNGSQLFENGELERTAFYRDVLAPLDVHYSMGGMVSVEASGLVTALSISRDRRRPNFGNEEMQLLERLLPHVRNVYALQQRLDQLQQLAFAFDHLGTAIWLLDADGRILRLNPAAQALLEGRNCGIRHNDSRLTAIWRPDRRALQGAINDALRSGLRKRTEVLLHDAGGRPWALCRLHPVHSTTFTDWMVPATVGAMAFLHPLSPAAPDNRKVLRQAFELTPAEAQLAQALLQHGSLAACRDVLGKSHETLRSQLKALFAKTGTRRQSELVQLLQRVAG